MWAADHPYSNEKLGPILAFYTPPRTTRRWCEKDREITTTKARATPSPWPPNDDKMVDYLRPAGCPPPA